MGLLITLILNADLLVLELKTTSALQVLLLIRAETHGNTTRTNELSQTTPDSLFGEVPDLDSRTAAEIAKDREKWKILSPSKRC